MLSRGPHENRARPAIDPLFRSAAAAADSQAVGVLLTGVLDDGTNGLQAIKDAGGVAIVQDPKDAFFPEMPRHALERVPVDYVLPLTAIPAQVVRCCEEGPRAPEEPRGVRARGGATVELTNMTCPDCGGVLTEITDERHASLPHYQCHLGHMFSAYTLEDTRAEVVERGLWESARLLREHAMICRRLMKGRQRDDFAAQLEQKAQQADQLAAAILRMLEQGGGSAAQLEREQ